MRSSCPTCLTLIDHADGASQVTCTCGQVFSPYLQIAISEEPNNETNFKESDTAFKEIRDFGESLAQASPPTTTTEESPVVETENIPPPEEPLSLGLTPVVAMDNPIPMDALVTTSEKLDGFLIDQYFFPMSIWFSVENAAEDPLRVALSSLWEKVNAIGANGIVAVRWTFTPDGTKGVLCGTPVHVTKAA